VKNMDPMQRDTFKSPSRILIYSVGLLGASLGLACKNAGFDGEIIGFSSPEGIETAKERGCIDKGFSYDQLSSHLCEDSLLFLCSPVQVIIETLIKLGTIPLPAGLTITDIGSTKRQICETAAKHLPKTVTFIGGHPMAGSEKHGPKASDPYLYQNAVYAVTPAVDQKESFISSFAQFLENHLGCRTLSLDAESHDKIAATVSHMPHILSVALMLTAYNREKELPGLLSLAAGGFRDMTRIAQSPYSMWHDIFETNKKEVLAVLDQLLDTLHQARDNLKKGTLQDSFISAAQVRRTIPSGGKGFLTPLSEILVVVKDEPGVIAKISHTLQKASINIKDIEVMKIREGEGGTLRLAFESSSAADQALTIVQSLGFSTFTRE